MKFEVILERIFETVDANSIAGTVTLQFGQPYLNPEATGIMKWRCPFRIIGLGTERINQAPGIDSINALIVGLRLAEHYLHAYSTASQKKLTWQQEDDLGLATLPDIDESSEGLLDAEDFKQAFDAFFRKFDKKDAL